MSKTDGRYRSGEQKPFTLIQRIAHKNEFFYQLCKFISSKNKKYVARAEIYFKSNEREVLNGWI